MSPAPAPSPPASPPSPARQRHCPGQGAGVLGLREGSPQGTHFDPVAAFNLAMDTHDTIHLMLRFMENTAFLLD